MTKNLPLSTFVRVDNLQLNAAEDFLWHGSKERLPVIEARQAIDIGGNPGSNQNAIYATSDKNFAIIAGMAEPGSDGACFHDTEPVQGILFSGKLRHGKMVYLHKLAKKDKEGNDIFLPGGPTGEFYSRPGIKSLVPVEIEATPVDSHLDLMRSPTKKDWELHKKYSKLKETASGK